MYPFIEKYDFIQLIEEFEIYAKNETKDKKYKFNNERTSKRKKEKVDIMENSLLTIFIGISLIALLYTFYIIIKSKV